MTPKQSNAHKPKFTPVLPKKARGPKSDPKLLPTTGVLLTRVGNRKHIEQQSINMSDILTAITTIDLHAYILPHNCNPHRMVKVQHMLKSNQDYTSFMDITRTNWGKPSDNKSRIALSFYIASEIILDGLDAVKKSHQFQGSSTNINLQ